MLWVCLVSGLWTVEAAAELLINEFLPDPEGADGGKEFVELLNTGSQDLDLLGVRLEFANGIEGAVWDSRWACSESTILPAGARFLLVDRNWMGEVPGQAEVWLGLQNGPDAIRLVQGEQVLDLVGYGPLTDPQMMETSPASVTPGQAVARRPDGQDTGNNALDFVSHPPTPSLPNFLPYALSLEALTLDPPSADRSGARMVVQANLANTGTQDLPSAPILLRCFGRDHEALLDACASGESRSVLWLVEAGLPGTWALEIEVLLDQAQGALVVPAGSCQVGPAELLLNEVLSAPAAGQGEWVELVCNGDWPLSLQDYALREEDGAWQGLPDFTLQPGDLVVLAQQPSALNDWLRDNGPAGAGDGCSGQEFDPVILALPGSWPTLNNSIPESREFADRVYLADLSGTVLDHVTLGAPGASEGLTTGVSWERIAFYPTNPTAENWAPCTSLTTGTPGCRNSVSYGFEARATLTVTPGFLDPEGGVTTLHFRFEVSSPAWGWWLQVFNTWGEPVRDLGGDLQGQGPRDLIWDGTNDQGQAVPQGAYIVHLQVRGADGETIGSEKLLTAVRRRHRW